MRRLALLFCALAWPTLSSATDDAWLINQGDNGCVATTTYSAGNNSETKLNIVNTLDNDFVMTIANPSWSTVKGKSYSMYLLIDDKFFEGPAHGEDNGELVFNLPSNIVTAIASGRRMVPALKIDKDHEKILDAFKLTGTSLALVKLRSCIERLKAERNRAEIVPRDPFKP